MADKISGSDLDAQIERLLAGTPDAAFLVVQIGGSREDFFQFAANEDYVLLEVPLITERQSGREDRLRAACGALNLDATISALPNGHRFLNCDVPRDAVVLASIARSVLANAFGVTDESILEFESDAPE